MDGYYGHIKDVELSIYRGAYIIKDIYLNKVDLVSKRQTEFFKSGDIDLSIEWRALFHRMIVGKLIFHSSELIFTKDKAELGDVRKDSSNFRKLLKEFMPLKVNRFEVIDGTIHYVDNSSSPEIDVSLKQTHILALNLSNVTQNRIELPSTVTAQASVYEGTLNFNMKLDALADNAKFVLNAELRNTNLVLLNAFLKAYGNFDVNRGTFSLYTEMATKDGKFKGYVKPFIKDLKVVGPQDRNDSFLQKIWEHMVGAAGVLLKNQRKDQLASKIPMEGTFNSPKPDALDGIWEVLRNAFIQALIPSIDNEISIHSITAGADQREDKKGVLWRMFSPGKRNTETKNE